jgi:transcriptional regulator with XRE-family HTH domain
VKKRETIGDRILRLRLERGLSVADLASAVGVSEGAIRQLEAGTTKSPGLMLGLRIADCLSADPWYLALGEGTSLTDRLIVIERRLDALEQRRTG